MLLINKKIKKSFYKLCVFVPSWQRGFSLIELVITFFLLTLIGTLIFSIFLFTKENISTVHIKSQNLLKEEKILTFLNLSFKYLFIDTQANKKIIFKKNSDYLNNRKDSIQFYSTYPYRKITEFEITFNENNLAVQNKDNSDTEISIENIEEFKLTFFKNDKKLDTLDNVNFGSKLFDYLTINIKINNQNYFQKVKPYILY